jgi:perosamine synthetase
MNFKQTPIIGTPITLPDLAHISKAIFSKNQIRTLFEEDLKKFFNSQHCHLTCSGRSAAYVILRILKNLSKKREVIIPAYVCSSVVIAIKKAGLKVKLCDMSRNTFQMDLDTLEIIVTDDTLCIMPVHLFGLACDMNRINHISNERNIYVIENFAQSMGTTINGKMSGTISRVGFTSFGKGKNFPTYTGGVVVTDDEILSKRIQSELNKLPNPSLQEKINHLLNLLTYSMAVNPYFYRILHELMPRIKPEYHQPISIETKQYTEFQAAVGRSLLKRYDKYMKKRHKNGMFLYDALKDIDFITLPEILANTTPIFNRFPILFNDTKMREKAEQELSKAGITACRLYEMPMHKGFSDLWDGKGPDPYPNASTFCKNLTALPIHPFVDEEVLKRIVDVLMNL